MKLSSEHAWDPDELLRHAAWIQHLARELVRDPGLAEDLVQETWLAYLKGRPSTERSLRPWLSRVLRNKAARVHRRRSAREAREQATAQAENLPGADELVQRAELGRELAGLVLELEDPYRVTLLMHFYEGLEPHQIARRRGIPAATARTHLRRGLDQVRVKLRARHGDDKWQRAMAPLLVGVLPRESGQLMGSSWMSSALVPMSASVLLLVGWLGVRAWQGEAATDLEPALADAEAADELIDSDNPGPRDTRPRSHVASPRRLQLLAPDGSILAGFGLESSEGLLQADGEGWVALRSAETSVKSVGHGSFATERRASHGRMVRTQETPREHPVPEGEQLTLPAGPAFQVSLRGPHGGAALEARLFATSENTLRDTMRVVYLADLLEPGFGSDLPWVRFPALGGPEDEPLTWNLELRRVDGLARGVAQGISVEGARLRPVTVTMEATGNLQAYPQGAREGLGYDLVLTPEQGLQRSLDLQADGSLRARWLKPGTYGLRVAGAHYAPWSREVSIEPGHNSLDVLLTALPPGGELRGTVTSRSGGYTGQLLLFLVADDDGRVLSTFPTTWQQVEGRQQASFSFSGVPGVPCSIDVLSLASSAQARRPRGLRAPQDHIDIVLEDERPRCDWIVTAVDAANGEPLDEFTFEVQLQGQWRRGYRRQPGPEPRWHLSAGENSWNYIAGEAPLQGLDQEAAFSFEVRAKGYQAMSGDAQDFLLLATGQRALECRLQVE